VTQPAAARNEKDFMSQRDTRVVRDDDDARAASPAREREEEGEAIRVLVPWEQLPPAVLSNVIEEFVTREGTEYGEHDVPLETKVAQVRRQLEKGDIVVLFDGKSETVNLVPKREVPPDVL
jgi:uncharacterized protein YheU (UPF0270 family)